MHDGVCPAETLSRPTALDVASHERPHVPSVGGEATHEMPADESVRSSHRDDHRESLRRDVDDG
jgi:hypothetical protein